MKKIVKKFTNWFEERLHDPERRGNFLTVCVLCVILLLLIVIALLIVWRQTAGSRSQKNESVTSEVYQMDLETFLSDPEASAELRQLYQEDASDTYARIEELSQTVETIRESLQETVTTLESQNLTEEERSYYLEKIISMDEDLERLMSEIRVLVQQKTEITENLESLSDSSLRYLYDAESNTLYFYPGE